MKWAYIHYTGCKGISFYFLKKPAVGDVISSHNVRMPDGNQPKPGDAIICGNCGEMLRLYEMKTNHLEEMADE